MDVTTRQRLVFVGLGNPGKKYTQTRHNLGFMVVEEFARLQGWSWQDDKRFSANVARGIVNERPVDLLAPQTYMNLSGWSVRQYLDYYKLAAQQVIVICDDIALPYGQLRIRPQGSAGGHNGLKSLVANLGTVEFGRLRMGVGSNGPGQDLADYVLSEFTAEEKASLDEFIKQGAAVLKTLTIETITQVMNRINTKLTL